MELMLPIEEFDPQKTFECGQVFRYGKKDDLWYVISGNDIAFVQTHGCFCKIIADNEKKFENYFDFSNKYDIINKTVVINSFMDEAVAFGKGIRILKQNPFETLASFIISQNNNISRIRGIIEKLCVALGEKRSSSGFEYFTFPTVEVLASNDENFFLKMGLGYRARYLSLACKRIADGYDLSKLFEMSTFEARKELLSFVGVGEKVADCVLLFGFGKDDVFPVDVWIEKVYNEHFFVGKKNRFQIANYFVDIFGSNSGIAQQYVFYYKRSGNPVIE